jgi:tetratricopeptide (TPR) repeat protein
MNKKTIIKLSIAAALASSGHVFAADLLQTARDGWAAVSSGHTRQPTAVSVHGPDDSWGDSQGATRKPAPAPTPAQDVRFVDERFGGGAVAPKAPERPVVEHVAVARPQPRAQIRRAPIREMSGDDGDFGNAHTLGCVNVERVWEGAHALAERGQENRAYSAYLQLFSTCTSPKELLGTAYQAQQNLSQDALAQLMQEPVMASPRLQRVTTALAVQRMYALNKAKDYTGALAASRSIRKDVLASNDEGALEVSGWLEENAGEHREAERLFRAATHAGGDSSGAHEGLVESLLAQGKTANAEAEATRLEGANADAIRGRVSVALAREAVKQGNGERALELLDKAERLGVPEDNDLQLTRAWALRAASRAQDSKALFAKVHRSNPGSADAAKGLLVSATDDGDYGTVKELAQSNNAAQVDAKHALGEHYLTQGRYADAAELTGREVEGTESQVSLGVSARTKSGETGQGKLTILDVPMVHAKIALTDRVALTVDGGGLDLNDGTRTVHGHQASIGTEIQLSDARVKASVGEVGSTTAAPGAQKERLTGSLAYRQYLDNGYIEGEVSREAVFDSTRSFAGAQNQDGSVVGPATKTEIKVSGKQQLNNKGLNLNWMAGAGAITASGTASNGFYETSASVTQDFQRSGWDWLNLGPEIRIAGFHEDQNQFTGGSGGYYSPKSATDIGVTGNALSAQGKSTLLKASGRAGFTSRQLFYGNDTGLYGEAELQGAVLLSPHVIVGGTLSVRSAPGYSDKAAMAWLSIPFEARHGLQGMDLKPSVR